MIRNMRVKSHFTAGTFAAFLLALMAVFGCDKKPTGVEEISSTSFPNTPDSIRVVVGDQIIVVKWSFQDSAGTIQKFNIYRATNTPTNFSLIKSSTTNSFEDRNVQNNADYFYQVAAVNKDGFESKRSEVVTARPGQFSVVIEDGAEYTSNTTVHLSITASTVPEFMTISNDSSFTNAAPQPFDVSINWAMVLGDGLKTIYVRFLDQSGKATSMPVSDSIILDTHANIVSVSENTGGAPKVAGDTLRVTLDAGEIGGKALASIENGPQNLALFDDGTHGDAVANDGIHTLNYIVQIDDDVYQARVVGDFTDHVGNVAESAFSITRLTFLHAPDPVTLFDPVFDFNFSSGQIGIKLTWTESTEVSDFASYLIYRSQNPDITPDNALLIASLSARRTIDYLDDTVILNNDYYYRVFVSDLTGLTAGSNEVVGSTR